MSIKNILVAFNGTESSISALRYAVALAKSKGAHVTAVLAYATHQTVNSRAAYVPEAARKIIEDAEAGVIDGIEAQFTTLRDDMGLGDDLHFRRVSGRVDAVLSQVARTYDLLVIGTDPGEDVDDHVSFHPDRIALMSGRPLILVPAGYDSEATHASAAIAWDGSRAAARAMSDALNLLDYQGDIALVTVGGDNDRDELESHLSRHGVTARRVALPEAGDVATALVRYCTETDAQLLVMGAYEHSKFREDFLGGLTPGVLRQVSIPVLMSH